MIENTIKIERGGQEYIDYLRYSPSIEQKNIICALKDKGIKTKS